MIRVMGAPGEARLSRGFTLVELLIVVTCVAAMLGLCAVTIQLMLRVSAEGQARLSAWRSLERLARQLRDDAHRGESARLLTAAAGASDHRARLLLSLEAGHAITYQVLDGAITRDETLGGKRARHESYSLPRGRVARFELGEEAGRLMVAVLVSQSPGISHTDPPRPLEIVASVGKHQARPSAKSGGPKE